MQLFPQKTSDKVWRTWALLVCVAIILPAIAVVISPRSVILDPRFYLRYLPMIFGGLIAGWLAIWHMAGMRKLWSWLFMMPAVIFGFWLFREYLWNGFLAASLMIIIESFFAFWPERQRDHHFSGE